MIATSSASIIAPRVGSFPSSQRRPPVISQTAEQPRVPPLGSVIADRDAQRLLLPDQHEQPFASCDPRVDQVPTTNNRDAATLPGLAANFVCCGLTL